MRKIVILSLFLSTGLLGCAASNVQLSITDYQATAPVVRLGDSEKKVLDLLAPTQALLAQKDRKLSETYLERDKQVVIHYFRSTNQSDGITTDDEFTPYVFHNGSLVAIGWQSIGGPKTQGQARPQVHVNRSLFFRRGFH